MHRASIILALTLIFTFTVPAFAQEATPKTVSFRIMSYNVGGGAHIPSGPEEIEMIADQIVDNGIDIAGITELDAGTGLHDGRDMVAELGVALAKRGYFMHHYYEPAFQHSGGWAVHALFSRWVIRESSYKAIKGGAHNTSRWVMGHIGVDVAPGTRVHVFMTHFWPWASGIEPEVESLFSYPDEFEGPKIIMGDFNAAMNSSTIGIVQKAGYVTSSMAVHGKKELTVGCSAGIAAPLPLDEQIDYIVGNREVRFTDSYVPYISMSDHWPIVAVAEVAKGSAPSEWAGDEEQRPRGFRFVGEQAERDRAMELYRQKKYSKAAQAMLELEKKASGSETRSFYAFTAASILLLDGDKRRALAEYQRFFKTYPPSKWTTWGHHRAAFIYKDLGKFAEAEEQFTAYMREYMTVLHPTVTTVSTRFAMEQIASCRQARGIKCSVDDILQDYADHDKGVLARAAHYRMSLNAWQAGNDTATAQHYELTGLTSKDAENEYLMSIARGFVKLGKAKKADSYVEDYLTRLSPYTVRYKRAEWDKTARPENYLIDVHPVIASTDGRVTDWSRVPVISLDGESHVHRVQPDAGELKAELRLGWTSVNLHVKLDVYDKQHYCPFPPESMWQGDSVQVAIDPELNGGWEYDVKDIEIGIAKGESGIIKHVFNSRITSYQAWVSEQVGDVTSYEITIPWAALGLQGKEGAQLAFDIIANDSDGTERIAWVDLTPGIGEVKAPCLYKKLTLVK